MPLKLAIIFLLLVFGRLAEAQQTWAWPSMAEQVSYHENE